VAYTVANVCTTKSNAKVASLLTVGLHGGNAERMHASEKEMLSTAENVPSFHAIASLNNTAES